MSINAEFRVRRERCGVTQLELARRAGVSVQSVKLWERGFYPLPDYGMDALESFEDELEKWKRHVAQLDFGRDERRKSSLTIRIPFFRSQSELEFHQSTLASTKELDGILEGLANRGATADDEENPISVSRANELLTCATEVLRGRGVAVERYYVDELKDSQTLRSAQPLLPEIADPNENPELFDPAEAVRSKASMTVPSRRPSC